ncbi:unnamed protein product [Blepharisma stoltei]|uniref:Uncharacterized protein n=1 Tax=Blepharisma stoltei TaxID=1481888 RepID=A0AAU9JDF7_9CILI|nr:unnamed protein product [Blepharisma stoltei]
MKLLCFGKFLNALCLICAKKETSETSASSSEKLAETKQNDPYHNQENSIEASNRTCNSIKNFEQPQEMVGDIEQTFTFGQKTFSDACKVYEGNSDSLNPTAKKKSKPKQKKKKNTKNTIDKI